VKAIVTGADCDKTFGVLPIARSEHPMARDKVRYRGEPVAAVAAVDDATAKRAIALIRLKVRELPAYYTSQEAMAEGASIIHARKPNNIERDVLFELGSVEQGLQRPISCARAITIAPRSARTRWRCMPRSPSTTRCADA
jgi:4-hydroxybenzoyl-CoA reductase subunit alpha